MLCVVMMTVPIMQLFCHWGCGCPQIDLPYGWVIKIILVMMIAGSSIVINGLNKDVDTCAKTKYAKVYAISVLSVSIVFLILIILIQSKSFDLLTVNDSENSDDIPLSEF